MKSKIIALALFAFTVATVAFYPAYRDVDAATTQPIVVPPVQPPEHALTKERPRVEVVFVLDTTGSMGGLIEAAKEKIWSIASTMAAAQPTPEIKMGLVAYRDRGDDYVTRVVDLSSDLDQMYATLMGFQARGGGDGPESVNQALHEAVERMSWSQDPQAYKVVFLVGDAPPHMDYPDEVQYPQTLEIAREKGIVVNAIQCGNMSATGPRWQQIAQLGAGRYFQVDQAGGAVAVATPYDEKLAKLSAKLDQTRMYYGSEKVRAERERKKQAAAKLHAEASVASRARRAEFNASEAGSENFLGEGELVDDVASGRVDLATLPTSALPAPMADLGPAEQRAALEEIARQRAGLKREIQELAGKRSSYLRREIEALGGAEESLDHKVFSALREQAEDKGLRYEVDALKY